MPSGCYIRTESYKETRSRIALAGGYGKWMIGRTPTAETIAKRRAKTIGTQHWNWSGDCIGYRGIHHWVNRVLGKPDTCVNCQKSGLSGRKIHWANTSGNYKREPSDWLRLCSKCHGEYDKAHKLRRRKANI